MTDKIVVLSTCANQEEAERLARLLVDQRLAACVNVIPGLRSYYRWKGAVEAADPEMQNARDQRCAIVVRDADAEAFDRLEVRRRKPQCHSIERTTRICAGLRD